MPVTSTARLARVRDLAVERPVPVFAGWTVLLVAVQCSVGFGVSWHSFVSGAAVVSSEQALHLYAQHAVLQIGPVTYAFVVPVVDLAPGTPGKLLAAGLCAAAGVLVLHRIALLVPRMRDDLATRRRYLVAGLIMLLVWTQLAVTYVHPDDVLALLLTVAALRRARDERAVWAGVLIGLAADCKPWALMFVPVVLVASKRRAAALAACLGVVAVAWLPFYAADAGSLAAAHYRIPNVATSSLRVLGIDTAGTPTWDRPAQILLGAVLALVAVRRGRWPAIVLLGVCARLLLDPSTKSYYDAGLAVGAVLVDLLMVCGVLPLVTASALVAISLPRVVQHVAPGLYGDVRTVYLLAVSAVVLVAPTTTSPGRRRSRPLGMASLT